MIPHATSHGTDILGNVNIEVRTNRLAMQLLHYRIRQIRNLNLLCNIGCKHER